MAVPNSTPIVKKKTSHGQRKIEIKKIDRLSSRKSPSPSGAVASSENPASFASSPAPRSSSSSTPRASASSPSATPQSIPSSAASYTATPPRSEKTGRRVTSATTLMLVLDSARARERERELLYPDACGGGGRGWISQGVAGYGRGHGTRETCALHTARLSVETLVDFWSALGEETRLSLFRMKEEDFIERLMNFLNPTIYKGLLISPRVSHRKLERGLSLGHLIYSQTS